MADLRSLAADSMEGRGLGTPGGARARALIAQRFRALGLDTLSGGAIQAFGVAGGKAGGANVVGLVRGGTRPGRIILVTAHYDHLGVRGGEVYNGADDNASGTAALMAIAALFRDRRPDHTVMFVALDGEEEGLLGAAAFIAARAVVLDSVLLDVNLDMVSRSVEGQLFAVGPLRYPSLRQYLPATACTSGVAIMLGHDTGSPDRDDWTMQSDQGAFQAAGIPFVYFGVEDHADYHRPTDDAERIDPAFFAAATRAIARFVEQVDAHPAAAESARVGPAGKKGAR